MRRFIAIEGLVLIAFFCAAVYAVQSDSWGMIVYIIFGYPVYLAIRFIIWAIRTLINE